MSTNFKISRSPDRHTFQKTAYIDRYADKLDDPEVQALIAMYEQIRHNYIVLEETAEWQQHNLEFDLRSTDWILEKVRKHSAYAQNLYAALCNNVFQKLEIVPILSEKTWSASWRHSGGIIADMQERGDYIDWYCTGRRVDFTESDEAVIEGVITDEVREDLKKLGWIVVTE